MAEWTEGVMGDGAVILKDGQPVPVEDVVARIAELEAQIAEIHASTRRMSFTGEWYLEGVRNPPGDYVLMRIGPVTSDEVPF